MQDVGTHQFQGVGSLRSGLRMSRRICKAPKHVVRPRLDLLGGEGFGFRGSGFRV